LQNDFDKEFFISTNNPKTKKREEIKTSTQNYQTTKKIVNITQSPLKSITSRRKSLIRGNK
jgi:hypothetical protein